MTLEDVVLGWLPLVGGITGLGFLIYMLIMLHFARKKDKDIQEVRIAISELRGLLLGRRR